MSVTPIEDKPRTPPGPLPFDPRQGDRFVRVSGSMRWGGTVKGVEGFDPAIFRAMARAERRGIRQRVTLKRDGIGKGAWVVQDVR